MTTREVIFAAGRSLYYNPREAVDFMISGDIRDDDCLYAELPIIADELGNYKALRSMIIEQALDLGIAVEDIVFPRSEQ